jgi:hypothetical protein
VNQGTGPEGVTFFRFNWLAAALSNGLLYISASGLVNENILIPGGLSDLVSSIFIIDTNGTKVAEYRTSGDLFNSAPLVVQGSSMSTPPQVLVSSALGKLYSFAGGSSAVAAGQGWAPSWVSSDLPAIPVEELPASTYCFLSLTASGTVLVTTSAGGQYWKNEKAFVAVVKGVFTPPATPAATSGLSAGAKAAVALSVLGCLGIAGAVAFFKVPAFASMVKSAGSSASSMASGLLGGSSSSKGFGAGYASMGLSSGGAGSAGGAGSSSTATASSAFAGSSSGGSYGAVSSAPSSYSTL